MYSFSQLLLRNCILGTVFSLIFVLFTLFVTSKLFHEKQMQHATVIKTSLSFLNEDSPVALKDNTQLKSFTSSTQYTLFRVTDNKANNVYNYSQPPAHFKLP